MLRPPALVGSTTFFSVLVFLAAGLLALPLFSQEHGSASQHAECPLAATAATEQPPNPRSLPSVVGQDAFQALVEMRRLLEEDPQTDWSRVDLGALRDHLVDMHHVVLWAEVEETTIDGGFEAVVTGTGRTLEAIERMVPAHSRFAASDSVRVHTEALPAGDARGTGVVVRVTTASASDVVRLRALGFFGFLVDGDHHRPHHWAMAAGGGHP